MAAAGGENPHREAIPNDSINGDHAFAASSSAFRAKNFRVARPRGARRNGCRRLLPYRFASDTNARAKNFSRGRADPSAAQRTASFQGLFFGFSFGVPLGRVLSRFQRGAENIAE